MKLIYCLECRDVVRLFPERRSCKCGASWGQYLPDNATTVQNTSCVSIGFHNGDFRWGVDAFFENQERLTPEIVFREWINPTSETDVEFVTFDLATAATAGVGTVGADDQPAIKLQEATKE
jgi:hypothetical protein